MPNAQDQWVLTLLVFGGIQKSERPLFKLAQMRRSALS